MKDVRDTSGIATKAAYNMNTTNMVSAHTAHQQFGEYQLLHLLGQGGSTEVYLGEHVESGLLVAIKLLDARQGGNELDKFFARASVLSHLHHPHIVEVFDSGIQGYTAYLAMSYASRGNLRQCYPRGKKLSLATVNDYTKQVSSALQYVHQHELIHRDVKPHNMLLGENNRVLLSDFGIAVVSPSSADSYFHDFEGTVIYAAPEQLQGKPCKNSDQYALAVTVFEWLTGSWPFLGTFDEIVHQHLYIEPPLLREKDLRIPLAVEQVVLKALAKEPEQRFGNIEAFAQALDSASEHTLAPSLDLLVQKFEPPKRQFKSPLPFRK